MTARKQKPLEPDPWFTRPGAAEDRLGHDQWLRDTQSPVLFCGEWNPQSNQPRHCLYPWPERCAGWNLRRILGLPEDTYMDLARTNLCSRGWSMPRARQRAEMLVRDREMPPVIVALGVKVSGAFQHMLADDHYRINGMPPFRWDWIERRPAQRVLNEIVEFSCRVPLVYLPHPSGLNRIWNDRSRWQDARKLLSEVVPGVPWGSEES